MFSSIARVALFAAALLVASNCQHHLSISYHPSTCAYAALTQTNDYDIRFPAKDACVPYAFGQSYHISFDCKGDGTMQGS